MKDQNTLIEEIRAIFAKATKKTTVAGIVTQVQALLVESGLDPRFNVYEADLRTEAEDLDEMIDYYARRLTNCFTKDAYEFQDVAFLDMGIDKPNAKHVIAQLEEIKASLVKLPSYKNVQILESETGYRFGITKRKKPTLDPVIDNLVVDLRRAFQHMKTIKAQAKKLPDWI